MRPQTLDDINDNRGYPKNITRTVCTPPLLGTVFNTVADLEVGMGMERSTTALLYGTPAAQRWRWPSEIVRHCGLVYRPGWRKDKQKRAAWLAEEEAQNNPQDGRNNHFLETSNFGFQGSWGARAAANTI